MVVCTAMSALQLAGVVLTFLLTVIWLDMFWVRAPEEQHKRDLEPTLRRGLLNLFVAAGGAAAAVMLLV